MERRAAVRYRLRAPVIVRWSDESGRRREDLGRTRDISTAGVFLTCRALPPVGAELDLEVHLPPFERNTLQRLQLKATGKVIRVTETAQEAGFAVASPFTLHDNLLDRIVPKGRGTSA